jgi:hypothetical protein
MRSLCLSHRLRTALSAILLMLLMLAAVLPVSAQTTVVREESPFTAFTIPAGPLGCATFDVFVEPTTDRVRSTTMIDAAGNVRMQILSGALKVLVTNLSTGESQHLNISGPVKLAPQADGSLRVTTGGPTFWWFFEPGVAPGQPIVGLYHGKTVSEFDAAGNFRFLSARGRVQDVCAMLAG